MNNFEKLLQNFSSISKCDLNLNFKNSYKLLNILKNIKVLLSDNKLRNDDNFKVAAKVIDEFNQSKAYHKKLNELLEESRNYQKEHNTYSGAFGYLEKGIELIIEDLEK